MKTLAPISAVALLLMTACAQPAKAPQACPMPCGGAMACEHPCGEHPRMPPPEMQRGAGMPREGAGPMPGGPMGRVPPRPPRRGPPMGPGGEREVMRELAMLGVRFYPPQMLLRRSAELGLTPDQIGKIRQEVLGAQARSVDLEAKAEKARIEATRLLTADKVDERAVGAQIDEAAKAGAELRKLQLGVMLHVRGLLTPEQLKKLEERKPPRMQGKPPAGPQTQATDDDQDDDDSDDEAGG